MDPRAAATHGQATHATAPHGTATHGPDPEAIEFVRFCHGRRRVGWPELYDEMCAVAARGLFRGYSAEDLEAHGVRFGLFDMPALAGLTREVVAAELAARRPVEVAIRVLPMASGATGIPRIPEEAAVVPLAPSAPPVVVPLSEGTFPVRVLRAVTAGV